MENTKDLESADSIQIAGYSEKKPEQVNSLCNEPESTDLLVTWDGPNDPACPLNWPIATRWSLTLLTSLGGLVTLMSGSMMAPALGTISHDLHINEDEANMVVSIFVLAFAFGPMVLGPMTEVFGRRRVWLICSIWYVLWNTVCGFARTKGILLAGRILSGIGASAEFAVTNPVLGDCWEPEKRGYSFAIATFIPLLGPAIGPILGGVITQRVGWNWVFWVLSIFDTILILYAFFFFHETYGQLLLHRKAMKLRKDTGLQYHTQWDIHAQPLNIKLRNSLLRPVWMLATQPTIQMMSIFLAYNFGVLYFVLTSFASLWTEKYHEPVLLSGVHYISLVVGYTLASQIGGRITDRIWNHLKQKSDKTEPEYRVPLMIPGTILLPTGLLIYGWAAEKETHWIIVDIGAAIFGCGLILSTQAMQQYVMDSYSEYVASASAASQFLRSIFAFCFPLFAPVLYGRLGYGWGNSVLAFVLLGLGVPGPFLIWRFGGRLRGVGMGRARGRPFLV